MNIRGCLLLVMVLIPVRSVWGQGSLNFSNGAPGVDAPGYFTCGGTLGPHNYLLTEEGPIEVTFFADLFWGPAGTPPIDLEPLGLRIPFIDGGYFVGGVQSIPRTFPGDSVTVMVGVVETDLFNVLVGLSNTIDVKLADGLNPPNLIGLQPFLAGPLTCVPEPDMSVLFVGGLLLTVFMVRRRQICKC